MKDRQLAIGLASAAYIALAAVTILSLGQPADVGFRTSSLPRNDRIQWVMPASAAWDVGIRAGDSLPAGSASSRGGGVTIDVLQAHGGLVVLDPERSRLRGASAIGALGLGALILLLCASGIARTRYAREAVTLLAPLVVVGTGLLIASATSASRGWALGLTFVCLVLIGPVFLFDCLSVSRAHSPPSRLCWIYFALVFVLGNLALALYAVAVRAANDAYPLAQALERTCLVAGVLGGSGNLAIRRSALPRRPPGSSS